MRHDSITKALCRQRRAFSLIEAAMAQVIVGVAIAAMCHLFATGTEANIGATELTTAVGLADTIHEIALAPPTDIGPKAGDRRPALWALNGQAYSPPIDGGRVPIPELPGWSQCVRIRAVDPDDLSKDTPDTPLTKTARLNVDVYRNGRYIYGASWLLPTHPS